jgi:hypothetical protein
MDAKIWFSFKTCKPCFLSNFGLLHRLSKYLIFIQIFFSKIQDGALIQYGFFVPLFLEALAFVRNFKMQKLLTIEVLLGHPRRVWDKALMIRTCSCIWKAESIFTRTLNGLGQWSNKIFLLRNNLKKKVKDLKSWPPQ